MTEYADGANKPHDLEKRSVRALTEKMTVLPLGGDVFSVTTESGSEYRVDARERRCTCPDSKHNLDSDESCKHERRVVFAVGDREIPEWVEMDVVDPQLGDHVEGTSVVDNGDSRTTEAVADGGMTVVSSDDTTAEKDNSRATDDSQNGDCDCANLPDGCPCFQCYLNGAEFKD